MKSWCVIDIETVPDDLPDELKPELRLGNLVDPAKIAAKKAEWEQDQVKAMSVSPAMCKIIVTGIYSSKDGSTTIDSGDETDLIYAMWDAIRSHDSVVGYNHIGFDLPVLITRGMILGMPLYLPKEYLNLRRYSSNPYYDCCQLLAGWEREKMKSLDWWARRLNLGSTHGSGADVYDLYLKGENEDIREHCEQDVMLTKSLFERMQNYWPV